MIDRYILHSEFLLSKYFTMRESRGPFSAHRVIMDIKTMAKTVGLPIRKAEIREARKRLGIVSRCVEDDYQWTWENEKEPEEMWEQKSKEIFFGVKNGT